MTNLLLDSDFVGNSLPNAIDPYGEKLRDIVMRAPIVGPFLQRHGDIVPRTLDKVVNRLGGLFNRSPAAQQVARQAPGASRAAQYGASWREESLAATVRRICGGSPSVHDTSTGKRIWTNPANGLQVVYDKAGDYFRVFNPNATDKISRWLDQFGHPIRNIPEIRPGGRGHRMTGVPQDVRNALTHFRNTDRR